MPKTVLKFDFDGHRFGPGKARLIELIAETGSISQAAKRMEMSYRKAWLLVEELNQMFSNPCIESSTGGAHGGGAKVTDFGHSVLATFRKLEAQTAAEAERAFKNLKT